MTPPRTSKDPNKIKHVELVNGRWIYRPHIPKQFREQIKTDRRGRLAPPIKLGLEIEPWHRIVTAHAREFEKLWNHAKQERFSLRWLEEQYRESTHFNQLAKDSQKKARSLRRVLDHPVNINGLPATLGDLRPIEINLPLIRQIREARLKAYQERGRKGVAQCNREQTYLSGVVTWSALFYAEVGNNPWSGLKKLEETPNTRYVTDEEYWAQYDLAHEVADYLPVVMELLYLFAARGIECTDIEIRHTKEIDSDGDRAVKVKRRKGSDTTHIKINDRIQSAIDAAMALHGKRAISGKYLLPGMRGAKLNKSTIDDAMQRLHALVRAKGLTSRHWHKSDQNDEPSDLFWTLHDLKRKGITDAKDNRIAGHKSEAMRQRYDMSLATFSAPDTPKRTPKNGESK